MVKTYEGHLVIRGKRLALVVSRFNDFITKQLLDGCIDTLLRHGLKEQEIEVFWVPGCFEISPLAMRLAKGKSFAAVICLGAVIRGATPHFDYIASEVSKGIARVSLETGIPAMFGIITADSIEQAIERAGTKEGNKGRQAALNAIEMVNLMEKIK